MEEFLLADYGISQLYTRKKRARPDSDDEDDLDDLLPGTDTPLNGRSPPNCRSPSPPPTGLALVKRLTLIY